MVAVAQKQTPRTGSREGVRLGASEVATLLLEYGQRSSLRGGNPYRAKAYFRAAESLSALVEPLDKLIAQGRLVEIPGVGDSIADIITKLHRDGTHPSLEKLRAETPAGAAEMLSIPGLRADKVIKLHELGINSLRELEEAAKNDRLKAVKGLGDAFQRKVLQGIEIKRTSAGSRHLHRAAELLDAATAALRKADTRLLRIEPVGDFRRGSELVSELALIAETRAEAAPSIIRQGDLTVHLTDKKRFGITQLLSTGSKAHLKKLAALAKRKGMRLSADGLDDNESRVADEEKKIYRALGLQFIPPELREGGDEVELAERHALPNLVTDGDLRGVLHCHTDRSDGVATLAQMAESARKRGYEYFGVADHSKSAHYAGGLSVEEVMEQRVEADHLNRRYRHRFKILKGIETDILPDGSLDYSDEVLAGFDFVVASVHGQFRKDKQAQTDRILKAVAHPAVTILGHMTGRQLLRRPGYELDIEKVLRACARFGVAIEINANPWRLDLDWRWHRRALGLGCMMSINPDAHSTSELDLMHWGVEMARKGGVPAERVLNAMSLRQLQAWLKRRRRSA